MRDEIAADLSTLPLHGSGTASVTWWGTLAFILIEGTGFAVGIGAYFYLATVAPAWPMAAPPPDLLPGLIFTGLLLVSVVPNMMVARWAEARDLRKVRAGMVVMTLLGIAPLVARVFEFRAMNVWWDTNAYGSIVWMLLGLHTTHVLTDLADTVVLAALMFTRHGDDLRRYGDVQDNALYWNFVVVTWLPVYVCLYGVPRL
ncbi:cytochrome c oxidase subunit 3 [Rhodoplanes roseus]|uniref:Cytochrome C oxidase subunit III n=1 Tax=Rhodoplanes roseus TaxID=29409 RepID=A0A327KJR2_9BRAD|nr:cytochrome c oxidase subunit 3 [Rhodoplanes roseus]RAI38959.1 cytochrome C oxidase subunit III [Rhodoplanes roseus]